MRLAELSTEHRALLEALKRQARSTGHAIVARQLRSNGITHVYGISGTPVDETMAACSQQGIQVIATRHQQTAVQAAAAHNYLAGELKAAVIVSAGPGVSNCATGITVARANHWPLLVIGGRRSVAMREMGSFQELDGVRLFESITKFSVLAGATHELAGLIDRMCRLTMQGQPGPCYVDVAEEALLGSAEDCDPAHPSGYGSGAGIHWDAVVAALSSARRPVLIVGEELRWGSPWDALAKLVDGYRIPFVTSPMARGYLPDSHPLCGTPVRSPLLSKADLVLMAGASLNWVLRHGAEIHPDACMVRLAYAEDPVYQARGQGIEYLGQPAGLLKQLIEALEAQDVVVQVAPSWLRALARLKQDYQQRLDALCQDGEWPLTLPYWLREVAGALPENTITIVDGNITMAWAQHLLPVMAPLSRLTPGANGCMGIGVPFALAVCLAQPANPMLAISGDFALGLSIMDLETAVRHRLPLAIIVANNGGSGGCLRQQTYWPADHPERICQFTPGIRYDQIMIALGGAGIFIESIEQLKPAIGAALTRMGPTLIQIDTRDDVLPPNL